MVSAFSTSVDSRDDRRTPLQSYPDQSLCRLHSCLSSDDHDRPSAPALAHSTNWQRRRDDLASWSITAVECLGGQGTVIATVEDRLTRGFVSDPMAIGTFAVGDNAGRYPGRTSRRRVGDKSFRAEEEARWCRTQGQVADAADASGPLRPL